MNRFLFDISALDTSPRKKVISDSEAFDWKDWRTDRYPILEAHSEVKLKILRDYIERYVEILCQGVRHGSTCFRLTIVDGFCGGGVYADGKDGSPFVIMNAVKTAEAQVNKGRQVKIHIDAHYYFVDESRSAMESLMYQLEQRGYRHEIGKSIFLVDGQFENRYRDVVKAAKQRYKAGGRIIFFLDQCGYSHVRPSTLRTISMDLNFKAEFIINIAVQWFNDLLRDSKEFETIFRRMEIGDEKLFQRLVEVKTRRQVNWRYLIEAEVGPAFWRASGCAYWSPFYIRPEQSHRGYWLLHLAPHDAARYAMANVHWRNGNSFTHYGRTGLRMLAFDPDIKPDAYLDGLAFDECTRRDSASSLTLDLASQVWNQHQDGITVGELIRLNCNDTIADQPLFLEAIGAAAKENEIQVKGPGHGKKRIAAVSRNDIIVPNRQRSFTNLWPVR